jgi:hypothetical protein
MDVTGKEERTGSHERLVQPRLAMAEGQRLGTATMNETNTVYHGLSRGGEAQPIEKGDPFRDWRPKQAAL